VTQFNHPKELTQYSKAAVLKLVNNGFPVLNQCVLLKNVNDNAKIMAELFLELIKIKVKPYYIHYLDKARGTSHFRTTISKGIEIVKKLRGLLPGYAIPDFVIDIPGGQGKVPLCYNYINKKRDRIYLESPFGKKVEYKIEKNLINRESLI